MTDATARRLTFADSSWIALALGMAALPHAFRMPWWVSALWIAFTGWHLRLARVRAAAPRRWLVALLVVGVTGAVQLQFHMLFGRDPGIALLICMLALKLLEMRTAREATLLLALAFFLVLTNFLFAQTIPTALYLLVCVWLVTAAMSRLQQSSRHGDQMLALRTAGLLLLQSVPLMLALFLLFPRVQGPLWGVPKDAYTGLTGLSDRMTPGSLTDLILSDDTAFRVRFRSTTPPPDRLYWRGPVLTQFDGRTWSAPWARQRGEPHFHPIGAPVEYEVTLEPHNKEWLFALDLPGMVPPGSAATVDYQLLARVPVVNRMRYDMRSYLAYNTGDDEGAYVLRRALQLPAGANPRTLAYARELRAKYADDKALIEAVLARFRSENYVYTLTPPPLHENPVDEFLFDTREGFCEHYSSAFAVLMRAAGIPARIVTGYLGGEMNPFGDYMIVRQADAHAWTEVWLRDLGWVRVDPTAAVSPARVQRGIAAAVRAGSGLPLLVRTDFAFLRELNFSWDAIAHHWNQWVLGYNADRQRYVASQLGIGGSWRALTGSLALAAIVITLVVAVLLLRRHERGLRDPVERIYRRACRALARKGLSRAAHEGPLDYGSRIAVARPDLAEDMRGFVRLYGDLRYGSERTDDAIARFAAAAKRLRHAI